MHAEQLVIAVIRINTDAAGVESPALTRTEAEALELVGSKTRLAIAIDNARSEAHADVVVVLSDSDAVLAEASKNFAVNRLVASSVSNDDAIALLADSDDSFIDEDQEVEFVWFGLE